MADNSNSGNHPKWHAPVRWVMCASNGLLRVERLFLTGAMAVLMALILVNVVTRYTGMPIYWIDEAAVYLVVWLTFVGASVVSRLRLEFCVTFLTERLPARVEKICAIVSSFSVVLFAFMLLWICWLWMDPLGLARQGFDVKEYAAQSFNFLYTEHTQTLEWPMWALQLVIPLFGFSLSVHSLAKLMEDFGLVQRRSFAEFSVATPEVVN
jgi:TRAP-type C4-dicarboxylate transport system permease small subunit